MVMMKNKTSYTFSIELYLDNIMRMLHPFMPFVTEKIWQSLPHEGDTIVKASWPEVRESLILKKVNKQCNNLLKSLNL